MTQFVAYRKTPAFKDVCVAVNRMFKPKFSHLDENNQPVFTENTEKPTLTFIGTVKVHGTHGDVRLLEDGTLVVQSRNRVITPQDDNQGFAAFVEKHSVAFRIMLNKLVDLYPHAPSKWMVSGEWAGGNIQAGVAVTGMEKSFLVFNKDLYTEDVMHHLVNSEAPIYNMHEFVVYELSIDFNLPASEYAATFGVIVEEVEDYCPVGAVLNPDRTNNIGEGVVWTCVTPGYENLIFKTKGEKHKRVGEKPPKVELGEEATQAITLFIKNTVTEDRLEQGLEVHREFNRPMDMKNLGEYLKWVMNDVKSESENLLAEQGLTWKLVSKHVSTVAKQYYIDKVNNE